MSTTAFSQASPRVYADNYLEIRSSVVKLDGGDQQLGDVLTLQIELFFNPREVQVETLDAEYYQREFAANAAIQQFATPQSSTEKDAAGQLQMKSLWSFMVLDCPTAAGNCPQVRRYPLPHMSLAYRLHTDDGAAASQRTARFTPWPGQLTLLPSIALPDDPTAKIADVISDGAFPLPVAAVSSQSLHWIALLAGCVLLVVGWSNRQPGPKSSPPASKAFITDRRWQQALLELTSTTLSDEEFADMLRRALTWYCLDEKRLNPFEWLGEEAVAPQYDELHQLFIDVLNIGRIKAGQRDEFLERVWQHSGMPGNPPTAATSNA